MTTINYVQGDATQPIGDGRKIIVHCCNDRGAWGAGFVLALSRRWPEAERRYRAWADPRGKAFADLQPFELGRVQFVDLGGTLIANLIGQHGCGHDETGAPPIRYEAIRAGLGRVRGVAEDLGATVHMPRMGAGLAGGDWPTIAAIVQEELCDHGVEVTVYDLPGSR